MLALDALERWIVEKGCGRRSDALAALCVAVLIGRLVRVEPDAAAANRVRSMSSGLVPGVRSASRRNAEMLM